MSLTYITHYIHCHTVGSDYCNLKHSTGSDSAVFTSSYKLQMSPAISPDIARYVHRKKQEGKTYKEIASEFGHQRQWAHQIYLRFDAKGNRKVTAKMGRPRKNDDASERAFVENFLPAFRTSSAAQLSSLAVSHSLLNPISSTTMRNLLSRHKVECVAAVNEKPTPALKNRRIASSSNGLNLVEGDAAYFRRVAFNDKVGFDSDATQKRKKTKVNATLPR